MNNVRRSVLGKCFWFIGVIACTVLVFRCLLPDEALAEVGTLEAGRLPIKTPFSEDVETLRQNRQKEMEDTQEKLKLETRKLCADIDARHAKFRDDVTAIVEKYRKMFPLSSAEAHFKAAEEGAHFIASREGLCGFEASTSLAYKMAYDKVKNTKMVEEAISPIIQSRIVNPIEKAIKVYSNWTVEFRKELQMEEQAFSLDLALRSQKFNDDISDIQGIDATNVRALMNKLISDVREHARDSSFAVIGTAFEVALIKSSNMAIFKAIVIEVATEALSSAATGMFMWMVSPMDFVSMPIAIYTVMKTMSEEMERKVKESVVESKEALMRTAVENLKTESEASLKSADLRVRELYNLIK